MSHFEWTSLHVSTRQGNASNGSGKLVIELDVQVHVDAVAEV